MSKLAPISVHDLGGYLREQRQAAQLSLRQLSEVAGVSNPYLSQIERGLKKPSAEILQQLARGLRISAESLYVRAGILEEQADHGDAPVVDVRAAVLADRRLTDRQRSVLLDVYESFVGGSHEAAAGDATPTPTTPGPTGRRMRPPRPPTSPARGRAGPHGAAGSTEDTRCPASPDAEGLPQPSRDGDDHAGSRHHHHVKEIVMTLVTDIRRTVTDNSAVYVAVGVTDLAVEKVRDARDRAAAARVHFSVADLTELPGRVAGQAQQVPTLAFNRTLEIAGKAQESYDDLAERGEKLVKRLRTQKSTQDLLAQAGTTVRLGKGAVTTARKAAAETQRAARATRDHRSPRGGRRGRDRGRVGAGGGGHQRQGRAQVGRRHPHPRQAHEHHGPQARRLHRARHQGHGHQRPQDGVDRGQGHQGRRHQGRRLTTAPGR